MTADAQEADPKLEEFRQMCLSHDLTYCYSDDNRYWAAGSRSMSKIREAAKDLPATDVVRIWNAIVDRKIAENARSAFYWSIDT